MVLTPYEKLVLRLLSAILRKLIFSSPIEAINRRSYDAILNEVREALTPTREK